MCAPASAPTVVFPKNAAVTSIDGLVWDGKDLLAIQPTPYLARVARIRLTDDGLSIRESDDDELAAAPGAESGDWRRRERSVLHGD